MPFAVSGIAAVLMALLRGLAQQLRQFPWEICGDVRSRPY